MSLMSLLIAAAAGVSAPAAPDAPGPLVNAEMGMLQCYRPDDAQKTCQSIASYRKTGPGTYDNGAEIAASDGVTLETHTPVVIKGDAVCGTIRRQDILAGTIRVGGEPLDAKSAKPLLARIAQAIASVTTAEICTRYEPTDTGFTAKIFFAGAYQPGRDETVKWIRVDEGYTVTP